MPVACPVIRLYTVILKILEGCNSELGTLRDNLCSGIILNTLRRLAVGERHELVNKDILEIIDLCLVLLVNLCKNHLILLL